MAYFVEKVENVPRFLRTGNHFERVIAWRNISATSG